ncbi:MAG: DUF1700 domain-containing protein [Candidatus Aminicenantes bacterium]|nr:DUF1700 domain-containing protein [Candidatus Aminicenantes bacterium]
MNSHFPPAAEKIVADYLEKLQGRLKGMAEQDRQEILAEIRSHIFESFRADGEGDEIDRALRALKNLGEPADVVSSRVAAGVIRLGRQKKSLLYILAGALIVLFAAPLGMGGLGVAVGLLAALAGLLVAYFAMAVAFVLSGFIGALVGLLTIISPDLLLEINRWAGESVFHFGPFQGQPQVAGILALILSLMLAALGLLMLWSGKHIWSGLRFLFHLVTEKIRSLFVRGGRASTSS